jgi:predicted metal-dependent HD superfamily phosphohydrolase
MRIKQKTLDSSSTPTLTIYQQLFETSFIGHVKKCAPIFKKLHAHYTEPGRAYHNFEHIKACWRELDEYSRHRKKPSALTVVQALWFHDVIYDPRRGDNEAQSARLFQRLLGKNFPPDLAKIISTLILLTKHDRKPRTQAGKLICDIDLSILGQPPKIYSQYAKAIRKEYAWVPLKKYKAGRSTVLKHFLVRQALYHLPYFKKKYEKQARRNLLVELKRLNAT